MKEEILSSDQRSTTAKVVVASTVMLSFISFWRAAAIVLNDLGSTVYYIGGIVEQPSAAHYAADDINGRGFPGLVHDHFADARAGANTTASYSVASSVQ